MIKSIITTVLTLWSLGHITAQDYYLKQFNSDQDCPTTLVAGIVQDTAGYLWVGFNNKGLYRFDGYTFSKVSSQPTNQGLIELFKDNKNRIIVGVGNSTYRFENDKLEVIPHIDDMVRSYYSTKEGLQFFGTNNGRFICCKDTLVVFNYKKSNSLIGQITCDLQGNIWLIGGKNTVSCFSNGIITDYPFGNKPTEQVWSVCVTDKGEVLASSLNEIRIFRDGKFEPWKEASKLLKSFSNYMLNDTRGRVWFLHLDGITIYDHGQVQFIHENNFKGMALVTVFEDNQGGFWFGTTKGLMQLQNEFCILNPFSMKAEFMLKSIFQDSKGRIWTGSIMDGLIYFEDMKVHQVELPDFDNLEFYSFYEDNLGKIWITTNNGIFVFDHSTVKHLKQGTELPNLPVYSVSQDARNQVWASTPLGICRLQNKGFTFYSTADLFGQSDKITDIIQLYSDSKKNLWVIGDNGLLLINDSIKQITTANDAFKGRKWGMTETSGNNLWIATDTNGLICFNPQHNTIEKIDTSDGLLSQHIISIARDIEGNIVTGSANGLNKIVLGPEGNVLKIIGYNKDNGLIDDECLIKVLLCDNEKNIWFGSGSGLIKFKEPNWAQQEINFPTFIESSLGVNTGKPVIRAYNKNDVDFKITGLKLSNPNALIYSYFLEGLDEKWSEPSSERYMSYINLAPGKYTFKVMTLSKDNPLMSSTNSFEFVIEAPFWHHWLFILSIFGIIAISLFYSFRFWAKTIRQKQIKNEEKKRRMVELELKFLRGQMNPHFMFNSINSIQNLILNENVDQALNYLNDFGRMIRRVLSYSEKETVTIQEELDFLNEYLGLEKLRFKDKINVQINVDPLLDVAFDRMLPMMVQPIVENAIKHGLLPKKDNGTLTIEFITDNDQLQIKVTDNGVGRAYHKSQPLPKEHTSKGIQIIQDRIEVLKRTAKDDSLYTVEIQDLYDAANQPAGTSVVIEVPLY